MAPMAAPDPPPDGQEGPAEGAKGAKGAKGGGKGGSRGAVPHNALFEACYRGRIVPEAEWAEFMAALQRDLPVTFRFSPSCALAAPLEARMAADFLREGALEGDAGDAEGGEVAPAPERPPPQPLSRLPWLPSVWRLDLPKVVLRKAPGPKKLHELLKRCTELGAISRQEAVSMVPTALLGARPGLRVLDACASPGMKTLQLLDDLLGEGPDAGRAAALLGAGAVVCNELDGRRCCMLAHHVLRTRSPAGLVIHHDALRLPPLCGEFDRVLCDVPCSGDGTIRKAPQLLAGWRPNRPSVLHGLQLRIARAGAARLAPGGRMVYSTCSMSPVEDEAVVAALLAAADGALELIDCSEELPSLQRRPGLETWDVPAGARQCKAVTFLASPEDAVGRGGLELPATLWPPTGEAAARLGLPGALRRCWRFYPHLGDSGGFFVALLRRVEGRALPPDFIPPQASGPAAPEEVAPGEDAPGKEEEEAELPEDAVCKEALPASQKEASYASVATVERTRALVAEALAFYGLEALPVENFFVRNGGEARNVYLASDAVRAALEASPEVRALIAGVRVFDENRFLKSSRCSMRLCQEGLQWLGPLMRRRVCPASPEDFARLLGGEKLGFTDLAPGSALREALEALEDQGSVAIACDVDAGRRLFASAERGAECVSLFVNQHELRQLREATSALFPSSMK